ncbi:MAG TPA: hypothetical protein VMV77_12855 [Bacteroidales bacterium]|nr:hypothetical protein [Bacteroidales bacterium]
MARQTITIYKGDADTFTETITNLDSLSGYTAKMYIYNGAGTELDAIDGSIDELEITYDLVNESSKAYAVGVYYYETKIWDSSDHVYTPSSGMFIVKATQEEDPE